MLTDLRLAYFDACPLLSVMSPTRYDRLHVIGELFDMIEDGRLGAAMSAVGLAELRRYTNTDGRPHEYVDEDYAIRIREMVDTAVIEIVPVTEAIALEAVRIAGEHPAVLPMDAIHVATALSIRADVLFTYDGAGHRRRPGDLLGLNRVLGDPPLPIVQPFVPAGPMFDEPYLAGEAFAFVPPDAPSELEERQLTSQQAAPPPESTEP